MSFSSNASYELWLSFPPLTSCCAAGFLTGHGPYRTTAPGGWGPLP